MVNAEDLVYNGTYKFAEDLNNGTMEFTEHSMDYGDRAFYCFSRGGELYIRLTEEELTDIIEAQA